MPPNTLSNPPFRRSIASNRGLFEGGSGVLFSTLSWSVSSPSTPTAASATATGLAGVTGAAAACAGVEAATRASAEAAVRDEAAFAGVDRLFLHRDSCHMVLFL